MISVERLYASGTILGGHVFAADHCFNAPFDAAQVALYDEEGVGIVLDLQDVEVLIAALKNAMLDG